MTSRARRSFRSAPTPRPIATKPLPKIVELTPDAKHLKGFGAVSRNTDGITEWLKEIKIVK